MSTKRLEATESKRRSVGAALEEREVTEGGKGIGHLAVEAGLITNEQLSSALAEQKKSGRPLSDLLEELCGLSAEIVQNLMAESAGIESIDLSRVAVDPEAVRRVPLSFAREHRVLPVSLSDSRLTVAMADPFELATLEQLQFMTQLYVDARYAPESKIAEAIEQYYVAEGNGRTQAKTNGGDEGYGVSSEGEETVGPQIIRLVDALLSRAIGEEATDIHVEPEENNVRTRFRIDGILHGRPAIAKPLQPAVTARIKIMANMDISENRLPQDGRIGFLCEGKNYDLRVSSFPTICGEKLVLRILDKERMIVGLEELGFSPSALATFKRCVQRPSGIILVTGPTGSGKTTTLYSTLTFVNTAEKNTMTLEDPVEYEMTDINQSQINPKAGMTFASGLRSILRQDPDIILVGEMRDAETVDVAIRAALTGHMVFSTLHTNDAVGAIPRLLDMEVNSSLMASSFIAVVGQRLVRKICPHCKEKTTPEPSLLEIVGLKGDETFYQGKGCGRCFRTGYKGRIGIFEILTISPRIAQMIVQKSSSQAILQAAREEGMVTMMEDGVEKALGGVTTLDEVVRVAYTL